MNAYLLGNQLTVEDQEYVLRAYVHRFTKTHVPSWAAKKMDNGKAYKPQFKDDQDWLTNTKFKVRKNGKLDMCSKFCESYPTWPEGKE